MTRLAKHAALPLLTVMVLASALADPLRSQSDGAAHRDAWQRVPAILEAVGAVPGARIADVGAGQGYFIPHLRSALGEDGRVYAVDISRDAMARLRADIDRQDIRNVEVILGETDDPRLPWAGLDGAIVVNAYHEMTEYTAMLVGLREALRPGGRLVIVDHPAGRDEVTRAQQTERHRIAIGLVESDLREAGFELLASDPTFIESSDGHDHRMWLLAARRPLRESAPRRLAGAPDGPEGLFACPFRGTPAELAQRPSPPDSTEVRLGGARIKACYSRPSVRGRTVLGDLVPWGEPWRTGANEPTVLRVDRSTLLGDVSLEPGWYSLYTVPEPEAWTVAVNELVDRDGMIDEWVVSRDRGRFTVPVEETGSHIETMTLRFEPVDDAAATLVIEWESSRVRVPVKVQGQ